MNLRKVSTGFTLIELLIVVAIISIISAIAYPSYQSSVQKSRRSDAKIALNQAAALQEKWYFQFNQYSPNPADIGGAATPEEYYTISVTPATADCPIDGCFELMATAIGVQLSDDDCASFTLSSNGAKDSFDSGNVSSRDICW